MQGSKRCTWCSLLLRGERAISQPSNIKCCDNENDESLGGKSVLLTVVQIAVWGISKLGTTLSVSSAALCLAYVKSETAWIVPLKRRTPREQAFSDDGLFGTPRDNSSVLTKAP